MVRVRAHRRRGTSGVREHSRNINAPPSLSVQEAEAYFLNVVRNLLHYENKLIKYGGTRIVILKNRIAGRIYWPKGYNNEFYLEINQNGWNLLNIEQQKALIRHEAIHLNHPRHDNTFFLVAKSINAPRTVNDLHGKPYIVYGIKKDKTKVKLHEFVEYELAKNYLRILKQNKEKIKDFHSILITNES